MIRLTPVLHEIKRADVTSTGTFSGYASTWGGPPDSYGDIISRGAFLSAIQSHKASDTMPALLWSHDQQEPIGKWLTLTEDSTGLLVHGKLTLGTKRGKEAHALLKDDAIALSIGFSLAEGGAKTSGNTRTITKVGKLAEISLVSMPANSRAKVIATKATTPREYEKQLRDQLGLSVREAKRACAGGWSSLVRDEHSTDLNRVLSEIQDLRTIIERGR